MKSYKIIRFAITSLVIVLLSASARAGDYARGAGQTSSTSEEKLSDLTLGNFFSEGWGDPWKKRAHADGAPDMTLLRVQTNLLLRSLRTDYYYQRLTNKNSDRDVQYLSQLIEYAFNRRLMLAVFGSYEWVDSRLGEDVNGPAWGAFARVQMIDTAHASYALNFKVTAPNGGLDEKQATLSAALAGWHDLTPLGLDRVGLYWHVQEETLAGPHAPGVRQNDLTYDISLARTWTRSDAPLGNFSTFVEAYAKSDIDGPHPGRTSVTLTPGLRCTIAHHHVLMLGVDLPLTHPRTFDETFRLTYIYSF